MKRPYLVAAALSLVSVAAQGQDAAAPPTAAEPAQGPTQTVEGAQEFLRLITSQFSFVSAEIADANNYRRSTDIRLEPTGPCTSRASHRYEWRQGSSQSDPNMGPTASFAAMLADVTRTYSLDAATAETYRKAYISSLLPAEINWSSVSSVKTYKSAQHEPTERAVFVQAQPGFFLIAPDAPSAARVAYAMEFLRSACDQSASTGF